MRIPNLSTQMQEMKIFVRVLDDDDAFEVFLFSREVYRNILVDPLDIHTHQQAFY
jgi:hypothetical protein